MHIILSFLYRPYDKIADNRYYYSLVIMSLTFLYTTSQSGEVVQHDIRFIHDQLQNFQVPRFFILLSE
jgi:hypothetical protein